MFINSKLSGMADDGVCVRVLNPTSDQAKVYKNARIACAENIEKISRKQQDKSDNNTKYTHEFDFEKHVNATSRCLLCEKNTKVRLLCSKV